MARDKGDGSRAGEGLSREPVSLEWAIDCRHIKSSGLVGHRVATGGELEAVREALGLLELSRLDCHYSFSRFSGGRYSLGAQLSAELQQACIYSLEPVGQEIVVSFETDLYLKERMTGEDMQFHPGLGEPMDEGVERDFFDGDVVELGRLVYEHLSVEIDPYAQKEGASGVWKENNPGGGEEQARKSPFAALKSHPLKKGG